jgi:pyochelin biosynthetic protein PchC
VLCFPHAGGAASFFLPWAALLPDGVELLAVRYPGREDRVMEPPATTMDELVEPVIRGIQTLTGAPLVLFGHSMGALVAYEVARGLRGDHLIGLAVSGRAGPGSGGPKALSTLGDAELIAELTAMGGTSPQMLEHPEILQILLPALRADCAVVEAYDSNPAAGRAGELPIPVTAYHGGADPDVDAAMIDRWATVTRAAFTAREFPGGHFYLVEHASAVVSDLLSRAALQA